MNATAALTDRQVAALSSLLDHMTGAMDKAYRNADHLEAAAPTLASLTTLGFVESRLGNSSLRGGERLGYRLTTRGWTIARRLAKVAS